MNLDGLVGPTHHYGGLSKGNLASESHKGLVSNPRAAALEGLSKMRFLVERGYPQGFLPPHPRPHFPYLRSLGMDSLNQASSNLLSALCSASSMWAANSCIATPSSDSPDGKVHISPASLTSFLHRSLEPAYTHKQLMHLFQDEEHFKVHPVLTFPDEGAANYMRFDNGKHLFVHSKSGRQSLEGQKEIASRHRLPHQNCVFAEQLPEAVNAGVFHNDVISTGHGNFFLLHEKSFVDQDNIVAALGVEARVVKNSELSLDEAVSTYLFNSQIVSEKLILAPVECAENKRAKALLESLFPEVHFVDLTQSMQGGGGPACLRVRIPLTKEQLAAVNPYYLLNLKKIDQLEAWVQKHYRDRLKLKDFLDPKFIQEIQEALKALDHVFI